MAFWIPTPLWHCRRRDTMIDSDLGQMCTCASNLESPPQMQPALQLICTSVAALSTVATPPALESPIL